MKRGEIWTVAGGPDYAGKPRPAVIVQDNAFDATASVTICPLTSSGADALMVRPAIDPDDENGLLMSSRVMVDKITTASRGKLRRRVGRLSANDTSAMNTAVLIFLGLVGDSRG